MERQGIRRGFTLGLGLALLGTLAFAPGVAAASGGGGCGSPVTDAAGTAVHIRGFCFEPTILRAAPGQVVTFANRDVTPHTVLGANGAWGGFEVLKRGREATYRFSESGIYPYVCTYHPGMVGTVVVGDGAGGAIGTTTAAGPVTPGTTSNLQTAPVASTTRVRIDRGAWPAVALVAFALLLAVSGALVVERRRHRSVA